MALTPAYAVNGGLVPAEMLRMTLYASTSGATGIVAPGDLAVAALATPGTSVNINTGAALMANRFTGASAAQSYAAMNDAAVSLPIPATGSGAGRTDYVILRINDWHYDGTQTPTDPLTALYCSFARVASITSLTYPFVVLAKIVLPASTATITNAMITDMRKVALPREKTVMFPLTAYASDPGLTLTSTALTGEIFPDARLGIQSLDIPEWATRIQIQCSWLSVNYLAAVNPFGKYWVEWGDTVGGSVKEMVSDTFTFDSPGGNNMRTNWILGCEQAIPVKYRGKTTALWSKAKYTSTGTNAKGVKMDFMSGMLWEVRYLEVAERG